MWVWLECPVNKLQFIVLCLEHRTLLNQEYKQMHLRILSYTKQMNKTHIYLLI